MIFNKTFFVYNNFLAMILELLFVLFIFYQVFTTFYEIKFKYSRTGIKKVNIKIDVNLDKNVNKIANILGA